METLYRVTDMNLIVPLFNGWPENLARSTLDGCMKMENEIIAPVDGTVKQIAVNKGASVSSGDLMVVIG